MLLQSPAYNPPFSWAFQQLVTLHYLWPFDLAAIQPNATAGAPCWVACIHTTVGLLLLPHIARPCRRVLSPGLRVLQQTHCWRWPRL